MWKNQRMPHALLLLGPEGCGKLALALALSRFILCAEKTDYDACGRCPACSKMDKLVHPDLHFVFPVVGSKMTSDNYLKQWREAMLENPYLNVNDWLQSIGAENRQGNISKDECLAIVRKLSLKTFESDSKVMLIWLPEYLSKEGNRLLKIIEEPPENTHFILVAERPDLILNTILSRCQLLKIPALNDASVLEGLQELQPGLPEDQLRSAAFLADGNLNEARKILAAGATDQSRLLLEWFRKAYKANGVEMVAWVEAFAKLGRENQKQFFRYGLHFLRELLQLSLLPEDQARLQAAERKAAKGLLQFLGVEEIDKMIQLFTDTAYYIERNAHPKIVMLDCTINLAKVMRPVKAGTA